MGGSTAFEGQRWDRQFWLYDIISRHVGLSRLLLTSCRYCLCFVTADVKSSVCNMEDTGATAKTLLHNDLIALIDITDTEI